MLRPTAYITVTLAGDDATSEVASAIKRSYSYIAPTKIVGKFNTGDENASEPANELMLEVRLPAHPYMNQNNPEEEAMWNQTVLPWLKIKLDTFFGTVREFNNDVRASFVRKVNYALFELILDSRLIEFHLEPDSHLREFEGSLRAIRSWLASEDSAASDVTRFVVPSDAERGDNDWFDAVLEDGTSKRVSL